MRIFLLSLIFFVSAELNADQPKDSLNTRRITVIAYRLFESINVDDVLSEKIWNDKKVVTEFIQREPLEGKDASEKTAVLVAYDEHAIYIGAKLMDSYPDR